MIFGTRYTCLLCPEYDLCFKCYPRANLHGPNHSFKEREVSDNEEALRAVAERISIRAIEETEESESLQSRSQLSPVFNDSDEESSDLSV